MKELIDYLNETEDNEFFFWSDYIMKNAIISSVRLNQDKMKKICDELNELLLKVKRGELGKGDD